MPSCTNATGNDAAAWERTASRKGLLRPARTGRLTGLRRDAPVSEALQPFVERYWSVRWDLPAPSAARAEVLSHPCVHVSVETGTHPRFGHALPAALVHGVVTRRFRVDLRGSGAVTAAKFRPGGFVAFTGVRPANDSVTVLPASLGPEPGALTRDVLALEDDDDRCGLLDAALTPFAPGPPPTYLGLLDLLAEVVHDRALVRVEQVAARAGLGVRSLQRLFATYLGVSPKAVLARYRLQDALDAIDTGTAGDLAELATLLGWYDQAHFGRDFRAAVGTTPAAYLRDARLDAR